MTLSKKTFFWMEKYFYQLYTNHYNNIIIVNKIISIHSRI